MEVVIVAFSYISFLATVRVFTFAANAETKEGKIVTYFNRFSYEREKIMKTTKLIALIVAIAVGLFILIPSLSWAADDGAAIYKGKCAACHGADAAGKPAAKIPSLIDDKVKKESDDDLSKSITGTAKHPAGVKGLPADDVKAVVAYIRTLQK